MGLPHLGMRIEVPYLQPHLFDQPIQIEKMKFKDAEQIASWRLCFGCGACVCACPEKKIGLVDFEKDGMRPVMEGGRCFLCMLIGNDCFPLPVLSNPE
jgi:formate hydrogenlyase subunit 6/NADH:ubiquinone oxidoreductase subunit I